jgi:hypothetical protein
MQNQEKKVPLTEPESLLLSTSLLPSHNLQTQLFSQKLKEREQLGSIAICDSIQLRDFGKGSVIRLEVLLLCNSSPPLGPHLVQLPPDAHIYVLQQQHLPLLQK